MDWFFKEHWKRYVVALLLLGIANIFEVIPPFILGAAIDDIYVGSLTKQTLLMYIAVLGFGTLVNYGITFIWSYQLFGGAFIVEKSLRSKLMRHLIKMTPTFFEKNRTGDLMARGTNDLRAVSDTAGFGILTLFDSTMYMLTILLSMGFLVSWKLTVAAIVPLPFLAYLFKRLGGKIHVKFTKAQNAFGELNDRVLESVSAVRVTRAYVQERREEENFRKMTEKVYEKNIDVARVDALFNPLTKIVTGLSYMIGLSYGTYLVFHQQMTLGSLVSFQVYLGMLVWPMFAIGELMNVMQRGNASLDRVQETLNYEEDVKDPIHSKTIKQPDGISFSEVTFRYPSSKTNNLANVSLKINKGDTIGIVGKTGSGKTTLIKQLLREYPAGNGDISISQTSIMKQTKNQVRGWIGYVPQDHVLFSKSVKENILFGNECATDEQLEKAIQLAYFEKDLNMLPEGLNTLVGEKGVALSGGQKQRISIARALIKNPDILILDDSLSAVDAKTESHIIKNIRDERKEKTTIITTHRLSAIEHADWIIVLDDGKIIEEGRHEQLLKLDGWYKEQYERQQVESLLASEVRA